ncbi:MAG: hypothetical protein KAR40_04850 [Candidatus Sabulitectum sp.]|nr:hypothetical protein [Candidatus Sabulitectum sp.]
MFCLVGNTESSSTVIAFRTGGYQGIGFAIPVNTIKNVLDDLLQYGEVQTVSDVNYDLSRTVSEALLSGAEAELFSRCYNTSKPLF